MIMIIEMDKRLLIWKMIIAHSSVVESFQSKKIISVQIQGTIIPWSLLSSFAVSNSKNLNYFLEISFKKRFQLFFILLDISSIAWSWLLGASIHKHLPLTWDDIIAIFDICVISLQRESHLKKTNIGMMDIKTSSFTGLVDVDTFELSSEAENESESFCAVLLPHRIVGGTWCDVMPC